MPELRHDLARLRLLFKPNGLQLLSRLLPLDALSPKIPTKAHEELDGWSSVIKITSFLIKHSNVKSNVKLI